MFGGGNVGMEPAESLSRTGFVRIPDWRGRDGNDPSVDIAKDADQRF